ncbi:uncharacterized protein [Nicotiana tomentosiformis]|uniref:uncharacterized protein n=1 Tax=Nicotiana tomentosiformis TaxID=4098 RepID=UPI00388CBB2B
MGSLAFIPVSERPLALDVQTLANQFVRLDISVPSRVLACTVARSSLSERIRDQQYNDSHLLVLRDTMWHGGAKQVTIEDDEVLRMQSRVYVPNVDGLRELVLEEAHSSRYWSQLIERRSSSDRFIGDSRLVLVVNRRSS